MAITHKNDITLTLASADQLITDLIDLFDRYHPLDSNALFRQQSAPEELKISVKIKEDMARAKIKLSFPENFTYDPELEKETLNDPKLKYSELKKMMKQSFAALNRALIDDEMPNTNLVAAFLQQSARMTTFSGHGDEFYALYSDACYEFKLAFDEGNMVRMQLGLENLRNIKRRCHERFK
ncbi:MAG: GAK system XXXCH domain-containing protein [Deltaproteobacteria bacterium]|nr:GAK system XXXCH domain-containing protein [Deltaproteobacteria bacterium]